MLIYPAYLTLYYLVNIDGDDVRMLTSDILQAVCNAGLSIWLVQTLGIKGLAYGTIISTLISMIPVASHYFSKSNSVKFNFKVELPLVKEIVVSGSTMSMTQLHIADAPCVSLTGGDEMKETTGKKRRGAKLLSWIYLLGAVAAVIFTVKTCCPIFYEKAERTLGLDLNGRTRQAFFILTEKISQGEFKEAFSDSYNLIRGNES